MSPSVCACCVSLSADTHACSSLLNAPLLVVRFILQRPCGFIVDARVLVLVRDVLSMGFQLWAL